MSNEDHLESKIALLRSQQRDARKKMTLFQQPLKTLGYFIIVLKTYFHWLVDFVFFQHRHISLIVILSIMVYALGLNLPSPLQPVRDKRIFCHVIAKEPLSRFDIEF